MCVCVCVCGYVYILLSSKPTKFLGEMLKFKILQSHFLGGKIFALLVLALQTEMVFAKNMKR